MRILKEESQRESEELQAKIAKLEKEITGLREVDSEKDKVSSIGPLRHLDRADLLRRRSLGQSKMRTSLKKVSGK